MSTNLTCVWMHIDFCESANHWLQSLAHASFSSMAQCMFIIPYKASTRRTEQDHHSGIPVSIMVGVFPWKMQVCLCSRERKELNPHFPYECSNQWTHLTEEWSQSSRHAQRMSAGQVLRARYIEQWLGVCLLLLLNVTLILCFDQGSFLPSLNKGNRLFCNCNV